MYMNQLFYSYLVLVLELFQPSIESVAFVCMVAQKLEIVLLNFYSDICQMLPIHIIIFVHSFYNQTIVFIYF